MCVAKCWSERVFSLNTSSVVHSFWFCCFVSCRGELKFTHKLSSALAVTGQENTGGRPHADLRQSDCPAPSQLELTEHHKSSLSERLTWLRSVCLCARSPLQLRYSFCVCSFLMFLISLFNWVWWDRAGMGSQRAQKAQAVLPDGWGGCYSQFMNFNKVQLERLCCFPISCWNGFKPPGICTLYL